MFPLVLHPALLLELKKQTPNPKQYIFLQNVVWLQVITNVFM